MIIVDTALRNCAIEHALDICKAAECPDVTVVTSASELDGVVRLGGTAVTPLLLLRSLSPYVFRGLADRGSGGGVADAAIQPSPAPLLT